MQSASYPRAPGRIAAAVLAVALSTTALPALAKEELPALVKQIQPAIVTIVAYNETGEQEQLGTGFFVDRRGHVITNRHVLQGASRAEIKTQDGKVFPITRVLAEDPASDLIKIDVEIDADVVTVLKLTRSAPDPGSRVVVIGSPFGLEQTVSDGIVSTVRDIEPVGQIIQITAPISPGSSGSPVVNLGGRVIGIATVQYAGGQNLNFAIPSPKMIALKVKKVRPFDDWASETLVRAGLSAAKADEWEESIALLKRAVKTRPSYAEGHNALGVVYETLGKYDEAFESYREAIRAKPDYAEAHANLGDVYFAHQKFDEARESYNSALAIDAAQGRAILGIGKLQLNSGDQSSALATYDHLRSIDAELANELFEEIYKPAATAATAANTPE
ncbi:MAG: trypsin-like peptidase domain-containing protein [Thermoanaerobaculia bacterium]